MVTTISRTQTEENYRNQWLKLQAVDIRTNNARCGKRMKSLRNGSSLDFVKIYDDVESYKQPEEGTSTVSKCLGDFDCLSFENQTLGLVNQFIHDFVFWTFASDMRMNVGFSV